MPIFGIFGVLAATSLSRLDPVAGTAVWTALTAGDQADVDDDRHLTIRSSEIVEIVPDQEFTRMLKRVAESEEPPTLESARRMMEEQGWTEARYILRIRLHMSDGGSSEVEYSRRPYHTPETAAEFLEVLTRARGEKH